MAISRATSPVAVFFPLQDVSLLDVEEEDFYGPEADAALFDALRTHLDSNIELVEIGAAINDDTFARVLAEQVEQFLDAGASNAAVADDEAAG